MDGWILGLRKKTAWGHQKKFLYPPWVDMRQIVTHEIAQWTRALEEADRSDLLIEMQFSKKRENRIHN